MPGRHSGGSSLGGGGGFRGSGNLGGGGFRGGGNLGGGMPGGGWGGGWRPRGPWYGGPRRPWFGGGWGWLPWMWFGPRWGWGGYGGGGYGCGGIGCVILLLIGLAFICITSGTGFGGFRDYGYYNNNPAPAVNNNNYNNNSNSGGTYGLAAESPDIQTKTAVDLKELHTAFDSRIPQWESQLSSNQNASIPAADAGLTQDNNTQAVLYGKCGTAFYLYVVENTKPDNGPANGEGYVYTTASSPGACHPPQWTVYDSEDVGGGWYFVTLQSAGQSSGAQ